MRGRLRQLVRRLRERQARFRRRLFWILRAGLPPTDDRGFVPRTDGDERPARLDPAWEKAAKAQRLFDEADRRDHVGPYPCRPRWSLPARPDDAPPSWDNVVRALEEDR